jgi:signal transduction histidine kinase
MASHEFRTPLSTILSSAYLVEKYDDKEDQPKREKHLGRIISSVNSLTNILNEFLSVGKIEEGKISIHLTQTDIRKTTEQLLQDLDGIKKNKQTIMYEHEGTNMMLMDTTIYKNILINLLSNAIKFSSENTGIYINTYVDETQLKLTVKDSGIGISKEDQEHLMERFFRGSNAMNIQGTGLGLHIVSKYVERLKGTISFSSELEKGTTFTITIKPQNLSHHEDITTD